MCTKCRKKTPEVPEPLDIPPWQDNPIVLSSEQDTAISHAAQVAQQAAAFAKTAAATAEQRVAHMQRSASVDPPTDEWQVVGDAVDSGRPESV